MSVPRGAPASRTSWILPPKMRISVPASESARFVTSVNCETDAMAAKASPRKPIVAIVSRSFNSRSLLVAWRSMDSKALSRSMPPPSSRTRTSRRPPSTTSTSMRAAPASMEFSTSSFRTEAGRSTTSPAAIWLITASDSTWIRPEEVMRGFLAKRGAKQERKSARLKRREASAIHGPGKACSRKGAAGCRPSRQIPKGRRLPAADAGP